MIMLGTAFWIMVGFFAVIGTQRTWTREIIATLSLILALFSINSFMPFIFDMLGWYEQAFDETLWKYQVIIMASTILLIAFAGYAGPTISDRFSGRLKVRDNIQDKIMAALMGAVNGYLLVGSLWGMLNYHIVKGTEPLNLSVWNATIGEYPFAPYIIRPVGDQWATLMSYLPIPFLVQNNAVLPILLVILVLFVLIVML